MHDLVSSREEQFRRFGGSNSLPSICEEEELRLLSGADVVVAIQEDEATYVRERLPSQNVLCAPFAMRVQEHSYPGEDDSVLFVGTNTAPNVTGLNWFLSQIWPLLTAQAPTVQLNVAGSVCSAISFAPRGVNLLGVVSNLKPLYELAGVVISPLLAGSGLKIKLIEALSYGKAIVCTSPTIQGVGKIVGTAVTVADEPGRFAEAILSLLLDASLRREQAALALEVVKCNFSEEVCYREFLSAVGKNELMRSHLD